MVESQALRDTCEKCHGEGKIPSIVPAFLPSLMWVDCPRCDGTGYEEEGDEIDDQSM